MSDIPKLTKASIIPCLRYRDASAAIEWLCTHFGLTRHLVIPGDDGSILHAQLSFGNGMVMLGSVSRVDNEYSTLVKQPDEIGGAQTQTIYAVVNDADLIYDHAKKAGARIAIDIKDEDYGGRGFSCYDVEGHLWSFGTYDPWA
ncbi:VOC family protein [Undibacterium sp. TJN25]|uniref:VOC family protein n=1 Tax=Undibacterium sp. TJN25 TaxID=3413056 RepID=UPI003BF237C9